ncbi:MAG: hypothetical protein Q9226_008726, partial [Calogaya cf. arnoldii]
MELPNFMFTAWRLRSDDIPQAQEQDALQGWTVSSLCSACLRYQLDRHEQALENHSAVPSLASASVRSLLEQLAAQPSAALLEQNVNLITASLNQTTLRRILLDPRTPYVIFRILHAVDAGSIFDVDEAILANEQYIRSQHPRPGNFLVTLNDLNHILGSFNQQGNTTILGSHDQHGNTTCMRKDPPKGGFEFLDQKRNQTLQCLGTDRKFKTMFNYVTEGCLDGLDWEHVFIAGGIVLNTLLHTTALDQAPNVASTELSDCDIDLYLYDLTPDEANRKVEHIYEIWHRNVCPVDQMIVKTSKTITLIPKYPDRRTQIILKLLPSPLDILLNFDLDACAMGFDGSRVLMLPRAARALETGYSTFTMDLIWGHHLGNRRESQEVRIFKYADRGFGLRILPSYVRSLEETGSEDAEFDLQADRGGPTRVFESEPGLTTLRRIAYLARLFVHRYAQACRFRIISLAALDGYAMHEGLPDHRKGLPVFEVLMRHCEAWRLDAIGNVKLERDSFASISYDDTYDGMPAYHWGPHATPFEYFQTELTEHNNRLFWILRKAIAEKLNIGPRDGRYVDYLTRRIRRLVADGDFDTVHNQQITMPLIIPMDLEVSIVSELTTRCLGTPGLKSEHLPSLIIVHDPSKHDPRTATVPSLADTRNDSGNPRYWLITNENMWAGQHRAADEVSELLTTLFDWFLHCERQPGDDPPKHGTDAYHCIWHLARAFRRRLVLPDVSDKRERGELLSKREANLFRPWALARPARVKRTYDGGEMEVLEDQMEQE